MAMFESSREPVINADDLEQVTQLLQSFDRIKFNGYGDMVAELKANMPIIGAVIVSLWVKEDNLAIYLGDDKKDANRVWMGYLHELGFNTLPTRDELMAKVRTVIRDKLSEALAD